MTVRFFEIAQTGQHLLIMFYNQLVMRIDWCFQTKGSIICASFMQQIKKFNFCLLMINYCWKASVLMWKSDAKREIGISKPLSI